MQQGYKCPKCGAPVAFGVGFCSNCQTPLNWPAPQQPTVQQPPSPPLQQPAQYQQPQQPGPSGYQQPQQAPQYQQPYKAEPPKKKTNVWLIGCLGFIVLAVIIGGIALVTGTSSPETSSGTPPSTTTQPSIQEPAYSGPEVEYEITGSAESVSVTLSNATGGTEQESDVYLPHTYSYDNFPNYFLYISAQNDGETGSVTVTIRVNGKVVKTSTSSGAYVIASASDSK